MGTFVLILYADLVVTLIFDGQLAIAGVFWLGPGFIWGYSRRSAYRQKLDTLGIKLFFWLMMMVFWWVWFAIALFGVWRREFGKSNGSDTNPESPVE
jgi:hypothetical protein